jgi:hypothetical protein
MACKRPTGEYESTRKEKISDSPPPNFHTIGITPILKNGMSRVLGLGSQFFDSEGKEAGKDWVRHTLFNLQVAELYTASVEPTMCSMCHHCSREPLLALGNCHNVGFVMPSEVPIVAVSYHSFHNERKILPTATSLVSYITVCHSDSPNLLMRQDTT